MQIYAKSYLCLKINESSYENNIFSLELFNVHNVNNLKSQILL